MAENKIHYRRIYNHFKQKEKNINKIKPDSEILEEIIKKSKIERCPVCKKSEGLKGVGADYSEYNPKKKSNVMRRECFSCKCVIELEELEKNKGYYIKIYSDYYGWGKGRECKFSKVFEYLHKS